MTMKRAPLSLDWRDLRQLFAGLGRINEEFEWVGILVLLHQFAVDALVFFGYRLTVREVILA